MLRPALAALALLAAVPARAAPLPDSIKDNVGEWLVVTDDGKPGCRIRLGKERTIGGYAATPAPDCAARKLKLADVTAWDYDAGFQLRDATRKLLYEFAEDETTVMKTSWEKPPVAFMVKAPPGVERAPFADNLLGTWSLRRPKGPSLCEVTLSKGPRKDGEDTLVLKPGTPCDAAVARLKLNSWRIEDYTLMFYGEPETALSLEPSGADSFAKTEAGKPLEMVRVR